MKELGTSLYNMTTIHFVQQHYGLIVKFTKAES